MALAILGATGLAFCQWLIFFYAPVEVSMGPIQKIFYSHLPFAIWALCSFLLVFGGSVLYLWKPSIKTDNFCRSCAETGVLFATLALLLGIIWAKKSWGVWWTWDPRLTTTLILIFIYSAYLITGSLDFSMEKAAKVRAVTGIVAFLDVPLVFFSARLFRSIHPAVFNSQGAMLEAEMLFTLVLCVIFTGVFWLALLLLRMRQLNFTARIHKLLMDRL